MEVIETLNKEVTTKDKIYEYEYRLIKGKFSMVYGYEVNVMQSYGIEVERKDIIDNKVVNIERDNIKNISVDKNKVHNLMEILYNNIVSPIHFIEVIGEYVDQLVLDFDVNCK
ncbi:MULTISPECIES: DUF6514 family protein [Clostridium]|uniref:DUF6514 family protein n=1 Tax=Clostridium TaxID=1485 RepID=UPI000824CC16|nr:MULTISPECIES: DUF6514 family protein [Clostridium]PJI07858.1 hypothetical protein CUB90_08265 [Clostridium sp. CT7]